ncbi:glycosyltransferase family 4 protein [Desulfarculus baarsii]
MKALNICYDMRVYTGQMHGMARYGLELLRAMLDEDKDLAAAVLVRRPEHASILPRGPRIVAVVANFAPYGLGGQLKLPTLLRAMKHDLYHCPFYAPPVVAPGPMVMTIHDLIHLRFPQDHGLRHRLFYKYVVGPAAHKAGAVLTVSEHSKRDICELLQLSPGKVVVTPNGVSGAFRPLTAADRPTMATSLGLPARYILGVGNPKPHKNLIALVEAHRMLRATPPTGAGPVPPLVLAGVKKGELRGVNPDKDLVMFPIADDVTLATAYAAAEAVCIPSLYEGFGLPALEAMACGAPLVASNRASLPEVVGEAALLCEPEPAAIAEALGRLLVDEVLNRRLRLAGPERAALFTWAKAARQTLAVYRRLLGQEQGRP